MDLREIVTTATSLAVGTVSVTAYLQHRKVDKRQIELLEEIRDRLTEPQG